MVTKQECEEAIEKMLSRLRGHNGQIVVFLGPLYDDQILYDLGLLHEVDPMFCNSCIMQLLLLDFGREDGSSPTYDDFEGLIGISAICGPGSVVASFRCGGCGHA